MANSAIQHVGVLGAGVIGASWTALFLAAGKTVHVYDSAEGVEESVIRYVDSAWSTLEQLGMTARGDRNRIHFYSSAAEAAAQSDFIQENVPERIAVKHEIYAQIESAIGNETVVASSASGLMVKELQQGWKDSSRLILGHPFNPPHLIPLVELVSNDLTADGVIEKAEEFYQDVGKVTIRINREVPAHVANRLQAALWREAIHLVQSGVASLEDVDKAVWAGPGLRWAAMGPHMLFHLGAGEAGIRAFCERYGDSFHRWWDDLGAVEIDAATIEQLSAGIEQESNGKPFDTLASERDQLIIEFLKGRARQTT